MLSFCSTLEGIELKEVGVVKVLFENWFLIRVKKILSGRKISFFFGSHLAPKYLKMVANYKKLVAIITKNNFYPVTVLDRLNCS